jgi:hypothetical protein
MVGRRLVVIGSLFLLGYAAPSFSQGVGNRTVGTAESPADIAADVRRLLEITGADALGTQVMDQMFTALKQSAAAVPEKVWQEVTDEFKSEFLKKGGIADLLIPIYSKHFTAAEIRQLIAFYESPLGKKLIEAQPSIVKDAFEVGQLRGEEIIKQLQEKFRKRGYRVPIA